MAARSRSTASRGSAPLSRCTCRAPVRPSLLVVILTDTQDGITVIRLNRPEGHNALVPALVDGLVEHLRQAGQESRPVVLTATGSSFCPGADLKWLADAHDPALAVAELVA